MHADEAYRDIADQMKYLALGVPTDEKVDHVIEQFKEDLGTLASESVSERGVAMPEDWVAAFHDLDLPARAVDATKNSEACGG